jgi:hypothetical protein
MVRISDDSEMKILVFFLHSIFNRLDIFLGM